MCNKLVPSNNKYNERLREISKRKGEKNTHWRWGREKENIFICAKSARRHLTINSMNIYFTLYDRQYCLNARKSRTRNETDHKINCFDNLCVWYLQAVFAFFFFFAFFIRVPLHSSSVVHVTFITFYENLLPFSNYNHKWL